MSLQDGLAPQINAANIKGHVHVYQVVIAWVIIRPVTRGVCLGSGRAGQATARVGSQTGRVAVLNVLSNSIFFETTDEQNCTLTNFMCFYFSENLSI